MILVLFADVPKVVAVAVEAVETQAVIPMTPSQTVPMIPNQTIPINRRLQVSF